MNNQLAMPIIARFRGKPQPTRNPPTGIGHPDTSHEAAEKVRPYTPTQRARVLQRIEDLGAFGATREELASHLKMRLASVCGRTRELLDLGEIEVSAIRRRNEIGSRVEVLVAVKGGES